MLLVGLSLLAVGSLRFRAVSLRTLVGKECDRVCHGEGPEDHNVHGLVREEGEVAADPWLNGEALNGAFTGVPARQLLIEGMRKEVLTVLLAASLTLAAGAISS